MSRLAWLKKGGMSGCPLIKINLSNEASEIPRIAEIFIVEKEMAIDAR